MRSIAAIFLLLLLAACATQPARPPVNVQNPQADLHADAWQCSQEAARYAAQVRASQAQQASGAQTQCWANGAYVNCTTGPTMDLAQAFLAPQQSAYAAEAEERGFRACMLARGWR